MKKSNDMNKLFKKIRNETYEYTYKRLKKCKFRIFPFKILQIGKNGFK